MNDLKGKWLRSNFNMLGKIKKMYYSNSCKGNRILCNQYIFSDSGLLIEDMPADNGDFTRRSIVDNDWANLLKKGDIINNSTIKNIIQRNNTTYFVTSRGIIRKEKIKTIKVDCFHFKSFYKVEKNGPKLFKIRYLSWKEVLKKLKK